MTAKTKLVSLLSSPLALIALAGYCPTSSASLQAEAECEQILATSMPKSPADCVKKWTCIAPVGVGKNKKQDEQLIRQICSGAAGAKDRPCERYFNLVKDLFYTGTIKREQFCDGPFAKRLLAHIECEGNRECVEALDNNAFTTKEFFRNELLITRSIIKYLNLGMDALSVETRKELGRRYPKTMTRLADREYADFCRISGKCDGIKKGLLDRAHEHISGRNKVASQISSEPNTSRDNVRKQILKEAFSFPAKIKPASQIASLMMFDRSFDQFKNHEGKLESSIAALNQVNNQAQKIASNLGRLTESTSKNHVSANLKGPAVLPGPSGGILPKEALLAPIPKENYRRQDKRIGSVNLSNGGSGISSAKNDSLPTHSDRLKENSKQENKTLKLGMNEPSDSKHLLNSDRSEKKKKVALDADDVSLKERLLNQLLGDDRNESQLVRKGGDAGDIPEEKKTGNEVATTTIVQTEAEIEPTGKERNLSGGPESELSGLQGDQALFSEFAVQSNTQDGGAKDLFTRVTSKLRGCYYSECDALQ